MDNRCVCCGEVIPEGRQVCPFCERMAEEGIKPCEKGINDMINWKVRIKNKAFWIALIPALALVIQTIAAVFGFTIDLSTISGKILAVVDAVFALLTILGIVVDPTTSGVGDSLRAMTYTAPYDDTLANGGQKVE